MRKILFLFVLAVLCAMPAAAKSQRDTVKILAIGNSFSQDAIEQNLFELAEAAGIPVVIGNAYIPGCTIEKHVLNSRSGAKAYSYRKIGGDGVKVTTPHMSLPEMIADEDWDYVSMQQGSPLSGKYETYEKWLPELCAYVRSEVGKGTRLLIHQTWAYQQDSGHKGFANYDRDQMKMYNAIVDANKRAAKLVKVKIVVPAGTAVQNARTSFIGDNMTKDGYHLNVLWGRYTAACTWFEKLFGNVEGNSYAPKGLSEEHKDVAQKAAATAVRHPEKVTLIVKQ